MDMIPGFWAFLIGLATIAQGIYHIVQLWEKFQQHQHARPAPADERLSDDRPRGDGGARARARRPTTPPYPGDDAFGDDFFRGDPPAWGQRGFATPYPETSRGLPAVGEIVGSTLFLILAALVAALTGGFLASLLLGQFEVLARARDLWDYAFSLPWGILSEPTREGFAEFARYVLSGIHLSWDLLPILLQLGSIIPTLLLLYGAEEYDFDFVAVDFLLIRIVAWISFLASFVLRFVTGASILEVLDRWVGRG